MADAKTAPVPDNLKLWNKVKTPPAAALHQILGGRLKGKTDINPQWRYQVMTEQFGQCGIGWKWEIKRVWNEPLTDGQVFAFAEVAVYYQDIKSAEGGLWSQPLVGIGGSMLVEKEREGLHANDEGYKMAITDALSVALKFLGVGADVYAGQMDSKYRGQAAGTSPAHDQKPLDKQASAGVVEGKSALPAAPTERERIEQFAQWFESLVWPDGKKLPREQIKTKLGMTLGEWLKSGKTLVEAVEHIEEANHV